MNAVREKNATRYHARLREWEADVAAPVKAWPGKERRDDV